MALFAVILGSAGQDANIIEAVEASAFEYGIVPYVPRTNTYMIDATAKEMLAKADALLPGGGETVDAALLDLCPNCRVVTANAVGYQGIDLDECAERGIWACNTPVYELRDATADSALLLLLAATRKARASLQLCLRSAEGWDWVTMRKIMGNSPTGKTIGIVGMGRIGQMLAHKTSTALAMKVIYFDTNPTPAVRTAPPIVPYHEAGFTKASSLAELLGQSQYVTTCTNLTPANVGLFGEREFAAMQPGSYFVNTSRGKLVDEVALAAALHSGHLSGAGLDVFEEEPLISAALISHPNVFMTPHVSSACVETRRAMSAQATANGLRVLHDGLAPHTPLNFATRNLPQAELDRVGAYLADEFPFDKRYARLRNAASKL